MSEAAALIAYWDDDKTVSFVTIRHDYHHDPYVTLHGRMQARLIDGHCTEILEYWPDFGGDDPDYAALSEACDQWKRHLHWLGYEVSNMDGVEEE